MTLQLDMWTFARENFPTPASDYFTFTVTTAGADTFTLPIYNGGSYNFTVDWGDLDSSYINAWDDADKIHSYAGAGTYTVTITGEINGWSFNNTGDVDLITNVSQWGCLEFGNTAGIFYGCLNMTVTATDIPTIGTTLKDAFRDCASINGMTNIQSWDVSAVTDMSDMFNGANSALTDANYEALLVAWSAQSVQSSVTAHFGDASYTTYAASVAKKVLENTYSWTITDGAPDEIFWDASEDLLLWDSSNDIVLWGT